VIRLAGTLVRAAGWPRTLLLAACTAVVTALLLVVIAYAELPAQPDEWLMSVVYDTGTRGGAAGGALVLALPPLVLLHQVVRFGTSARERRLAALRLAGATPREVRRLGAIEVGIPSAAGALLGVLLFWLLRAVAGGIRHDDVRTPSMYAQQVHRFVGNVHLVPVTVAPPWWSYVAVVVGVSLLGVAVGLFATRAVVATPLGLVRRGRRAAPRPWGLVVIVLAIVFATSYTSAAWYDRMSDDEDQIFGVALVAMALVGLMSLAPWLAWLTGRVAAARASSVAVVLGARRLVHDPRPAGRAAAGAGGIGLVAGGWAVFVADVSGDSGGYAGPLALVALMLLAALLVVVGSLAVHSVEQVVDRRPSIAALAAMGTPRSVVTASQRWELGLVAVPIATIGALAGALFLASVEWEPGMGVAIVAAPVVTGLLVWLAVVIAVGLVSPATRHVTDVAHLRAE